ncbi:MAG: hypothetical protein LBR53_11145 [Deltaproteobacteria bacterium]|jgi:hypothetical protein|nr:hypothetical protein [Deltaproteobacteria bacterium]
MKDEKAKAMKRPETKETETNEGAGRWKGTLGAGKKRKNTAFFFQSGRRLTKAPKSPQGLRACLRRKQALPPRL